MIDFSEFIDGVETLKEGLDIAFDYFLKYPYPLQKQIVQTYLCQPVQAARKCFILYLVGKTRSGKSTTCKLASRLRKTHILGANTTVAAIRRELFNLPRDNKCLILDDWNSQTFENNALVQLLKNSIDRDTATEALSSKDSDTKVNRFSTFSLKIVSSTFEIYKYDEFSELNSRIYPIFCQRDSHPLPQIEDYDLSCLHQLLDDIWDDELLLLYTKIATGLDSKKFGLSLIEWERTKPLVATGLTLKLFTENEAINIFRQYWDTVARKSTQVNLKVAIKDFIKDSSNESPLGDAIICNRLMSHLRDLIGSGYLPISRLSNKEVIDIMIELGYIQSIDNKIPIWVKQSD